LQEKIQLVTNSKQNANFIVMLANKLILKVILFEIMHCRKHTGTGTTKWYMQYVQYSSHSNIE